jgi:3-deoxy-7-phosphoheptulonate synthase
MITRAGHTAADWKLLVERMVAAGADGLLIEVHNDPEHALSDGAQSLEPNTFTQLMAELRIIAPAIGRRIA